MLTLVQPITLASKVQRNPEIVERINNTVFGEDLWQVLNNLRIDEYIKSGDAWFCTDIESNEFVYVELNNNTFSLYSEENDLIDSYTF